MTEYNESISRKTLSRTLEPVTKIGYMDGASDGQTATFQDSFNVGYKQGFVFGVELGFREAMSSVRQEESGLPNLGDQRKINCQICTKGANAQDNIGNLYNIQQEKNTEFFLR
ncbi:hypothetical protein PYW07_007863 [Mythimna separata]|uniref:Essential protein Yae1 N-terminal domain-containing protein n=1 Tax=Mythimna separata TaxID=271217 RepID=A0AAD7YR25_MYTSE|nr:hypothetical protein PYW07_007863 [Mythimna separata]